MAYVDFNRSLTEAEALKGNKDTIYFTTDTLCLIMGGKVYGIGPSRLFQGSRAEYEITRATGLIPNGTIVIITDEGDSDSTTALLGSALLGAMVLGN